MPSSILIVIPTLNEAAHIAKVVETLQQDAAARSAQIVIADGGSTDGTVAIIEQLSARFGNVAYLANPKKLQSAALNLAMESYGAEAEYVIRVDAHLDYPKDYCSVLLSEAATTGANSVTVPMETVGVEPFQRAVAMAQNSKLGNGGSAHRSQAGEGQWVEHGHHALMRIAAFRAVGGYDESFSHNEDAELDTRLAKAGFRIWLTGKTFARYYPRKTVRALFKQYRGYGRGRIKNILKHRTKPRLRQVLPVSVLPAVLLALLTPLCWWFALPAVAWATICLTYGMILAKDGIKGWQIGLAAMVMHLAWSLGFWEGLLHRA
jgi:succinoglycan biosynthesis protein ExoA